MEQDHTQTNQGVKKKSTMEAKEILETFPFSEFQWNLSNLVIMLRNRYRAVTTKQALIADQSSLASLPPNHTIPISSFFGSPRFFNGFQAMGHSETETMSPIPSSIPDIKPFSPVGNQFPNHFPGNKHSWEKLNPERHWSFIVLVCIISLNCIFCVDLFCNNFQLTTRH
ncbi:hypothetical protein LOK49_Contig540G00001 [Camellia lanceoleosa]|nr:hypothetical protein LOK49_Contig540G00001 [Camellia lanceoleosa]